VPRGRRLARCRDGFCRFRIRHVRCASSRYAGYQMISTLTIEGHPADRHNLVILSCLPIVGHAQIKHDFVERPLYRAATASPRSDHPEPIEWERPLLHAEIAVGVTSLRVINLHLRAPLAAPVAGQKLGPFSWRTAGGWAEGFFLAAVKRAGQALDARVLTERIAMARFALRVTTASALIFTAVTAADSVLCRAWAQETERPFGLFGIFNGSERMGGSAPAAGAERTAQSSAPDLVVRLERLETQIRQLTAAIEQLQFRNQQLESQVRRMQEEGVPRPAVRFVPKT
jgi:hypothetical protein